MSKKKSFIVLLMLSSFVFTSLVFAEEADKPTCSSSLGLYSQYIWRGYELSKESLVIFPSITVGYKGFGFNVWGDFDTDYYGATTGNNSSEWWETDMVLTYGNSIGLTSDVNLNWTLGWIDYRILANGIIAYRRAREASLVLYPHVRVTLFELMKRGIRLAVVSDAPRKEAWF